MTPIITRLKMRRRRRLGRQLLRRRCALRLAVLGAAVAALVRRGESGRPPDLVVENPAGRAGGAFQPHPLMLFDVNHVSSTVAILLAAVLLTGLPADRGRCAEQILLRPVDLAAEPDEKKSFGAGGN